MFNCCALKKYGFPVLQQNSFCQCNSTTVYNRLLAVSKNTHLRFMLTCLAQHTCSATHKYESQCWTKLFSSKLCGVGGTTLFCNHHKWIKSGCPSPLQKNIHGVGGHNTQYCSIFDNCFIEFLLVFQKRHNKARHRQRRSMCVAVNDLLEVVSPNPKTMLFHICPKYKIYNLCRLSEIKKYFVDFLNCIGFNKECQFMPMMTTRWRCHVIHDIAVILFCLCMYLATTPQSCLLPFNVAMLYCHYN